MAVLDFDYGTVRSAVQAYFGTDQDVGKGISLLLEQKLVQDQKYRVIDRNSLDKILKEQNFSNSDRVDPSSAAKIGRILGVSGAAGSAFRIESAVAQRPLVVVERHLA